MPLTPDLSRVPSTSLPLRPHPPQLRHLHWPQPSPELLLPQASSAPFLLFLPSSPAAGLPCCCSSALPSHWLDRPPTRPQLLHSPDPFPSPPASIPLLHPDLHHLTGHLQAPRPAVPFTSPDLLLRPLPGQNSQQHRTTPTRPAPTSSPPRATRRPRPPSPSLTLDLIGVSARRRPLPISRRNRRPRFRSAQNNFRVISFVEFSDGVGDTGFPLRSVGFGLEGLDEYLIAEQEPEYQEYPITEQEVVYQEVALETDPGVGDLQ